MAVAFKGKARYRRQTTILTKCAARGLRTIKARGLARLRYSAAAARGVMQHERLKVRLGGVRLSSVDGIDESGEVRLAAVSMIGQARRTARDDRARAERVRGAEAA